MEWYLTFYIRGRKYQINIFLAFSVTCVSGQGSIFVFKVFFYLDLNSSFKVFLNGNGYKQTLSIVTSRNKATQFMFLRDLKYHHALQLLA